MARTRLALACTVFLSILSSGCASGRGIAYFHDYSLAASWTEADKTFSSASYTKVYDDQLAKLAEARSRENLVLARAMAARRDRDVQDVVDEPTQAQQIGRLRTLMEEDWAGLVGGRLDAVPQGRLIVYRRMVQNLATARTDLERAQNFAEDDRRDIRAAYREAQALAVLKHEAAVREARAEGGAPPRPPQSIAAPTDLSCPAVKAAAPAEITGAGAGRATIPELWKRLLSNCKTIGGVEVRLRSLSGPLRGVSAGSELSQSMVAFNAADRKTRANVAGELSAGLAAQIKDSEALSEGGAVARLKTFRKGLDGLLRTIVLPAAKLAELDHLSGEIDLALIANVCAAPAEFDKAIADAAKCDEVEATSTTGKADAIWSVAGALAELADATDPRYRSVAWLAGAKAMVDAAKADAKLDADQAKAQAAANGAAVDAAIRQVSSLASAQLVLNGFNACVGGRFPCALIYFAESRNSGAVPRVLLRARPLQIELEYGVRRERLLAEQQGQLIKAMSAQMKAYLDGGVDPKLLAALFFDLGLVRAAAK